MSAYKDENLRPLFERREEIRKTINKLNEEYKAIEYVIMENIRLKENQKGEAR